MPVCPQQPPGVLPNLSARGWLPGCFQLDAPASRQEPCSPVLPCGLTSSAHAVALQLPSLPFPSKLLFYCVSWKEIFPSWDLFTLCDLWGWTRGTLGSCLALRVQVLPGRQPGALTPSCSSHQASGQPIGPRLPDLHLSALHTSPPSSHKLACPGSLRPETME